MDNYGNDYFMSQEGYASIDFTLLDRPNSNIASAPESTAALLPDLHVADSSFSSFDFLDGPGVEAFGGVLRDADEAHSRDQGGYRSELQKFRKERSLLQNSVPLHRGDGDPDSELPSSEFHIPFEVQKPISNLDFFSQGHTKESGHWEQQGNSDPGHDAADGDHDYFAQGQMPQQTQTGATGAGAWYTTWVGNNSQGDQTQVFFQTPSYDEASDERRLMQMKGSTSQLGAQMGYHSLSSSQVPSGDPITKATHSFLPTNKQSDARQVSNMGLGLPSAQGNAAPSTVIKSSPRTQPFVYEVLMNESPTNQFWQNSSTAVENTASARHHQTNEADLGGQDSLRSHAQSPKTHTGSGGTGAWYNTWVGNNSQGDQAQGFFQTSSFDEASDERRLMQMKGSTSQLGGQMGYHSLSSSQVPSSDPIPKATHSFLPTTKQSDSRQGSNMGLGLPSTQGNAAPSTVIKGGSRGHSFEYEGLMNGSSGGQFRQGSSTAVDSAASARRHQTSEVDLTGQDSLHGHAQSPKTHMGAGGWYNTWGSSNNQGDQTQGFFQTPSYDEASDERRLLQMKGNSSQLAGQMGYHALSSSPVPSSNPVPKSTHSFLPATKQSDSRQASNMGLGLPSTQGKVAPSTVIKSSPRSQPFDYEGLMSGPSSNQFRQSSSSAVENTTAARRHQATDADLGGQDPLRNHAQSQNYKFGSQNLWSLSPVEVSHLKVNDYDFLGGQYVLKGQSQGEIGQQLAVEELQAWHQHPLLSQSNQQQNSYQQPYQELSRHHEAHVSQQSQHQQSQHQQSQHQQPQHQQSQHQQPQHQQSRQQQLQQFLAANHQSQSLGNQLSAFLSESSLQDLPRVVQSERPNSQLAVDNPRALLQTNYQPISNMTNLNWSASDPSTIQGLAHDYLMGADNFNWQALALKASQVDPVYGPLPVNRRDTVGQPLTGYSAMQGGLQEYFSGTGKLAAASAQVSKPVAKSLGSGGTGGSIFGGVEYQAEVYDSGANLQTSAQGGKHQALGKMPFWQNPYPQPVEHNRSNHNLSQTNLPPRSPQVPANSHVEHNRGGNLSQSNLPPRSPQVPANQQVRQQMNWSGLSGQPDTLQGGLFSQNLASAEALKQSILSGSGIQKTSQQAANSRQSGRSSIEAAHFIQQSSSQPTSSARNVMVDHLNLGAESYSGINEVIPAWSLGQSASAQKDEEPLNLGGESNRSANEVLPLQSHGQNLAAQKEIEQLNLEGGSNSGKNDALPAWSHGQNVLSQNDAHQLNQAGNANSGGTISSGKDLLSARPEPEKRSQEEVSFLDGGTLRESNSVASPAPSPDSNLFSSAVKQKASSRVSSLSRNTLELLSKPEEPNESSSMNDEDDEEEEMDLEDSGANASSISLAHLRRNQASGPLSPQGFGLRLAPPSHLSQNSQAGISSRLVGSISSSGADVSQSFSTHISKEQPQSALSGVSDQALNHQSSLTKVGQVDAVVQVTSGQVAHGALGSRSVQAVNAVFSSIMAEGKGPDSAAASASLAVAVERSGLVARSGSNSTLFTSRMTEGKGTDSATTSGSFAAAVERSGLSGLAGRPGSNAALFTSKIAEGKGPDSAIVNAPLAASVERSGLSGLVARPASNAAIFSSRMAEGKGSDSATASVSLAAAVERSGLVARSGSNAALSSSRTTEGKDPDTATVSVPLPMVAERSGPVSKSGSNAALFNSRMTEGKGLESVTASSSLVERSGFPGLLPRSDSSNTALFTSGMAEGKAPDSLTASASLVASVERGFSGLVPRSGSNSTLFTSRMAEGKGSECATTSTSISAAVEGSGFSGLVARSGSNSAQFSSRMSEGKAMDSATSSAYLGPTVERAMSGLVARSGNNAALFNSRTTEGRGPDSATPSAAIAGAVGRSGTDELAGTRFLQSPLIPPSPPKKRKEYSSVIPWRESVSQSGSYVSSTSAPLAAVVGRSANDGLAENRFLQNSLITHPLPKKRKEHPALIPWRETISQSGGYVSSTSGSEVEWAVATNRIPDKDPYEEVVEVADTRAVVLSRAKRRLRLTTHLMQQITPPVTASFMKSKSSEDREGATYLLSKLALAEACRIASISRRIREVAAARDAEESRIEKERELAMKEAEKSGETVKRSLPLPANIADRFKLRMKLLENDLQRLETSPSAVDLVREMQDTERIALVNRLAVHHSNLYSLQNSDSPHRAVPQKYVTTVQMPNKLPEGLTCVSL